MTEPTLEEKFAQWLKENNATLRIIAQSQATNEAVSIQAFVSSSGVNVPVGWGLGVVVEAKK